EAAPFIAAQACNWMQRDMNEPEEIAKALKARLSELPTHLAKVDRSLHKLLPADSEDQAIELENQEALEVIKKTETKEIHQIEAALKRISEGTYGTCAKCGEPIDPRRRRRQRVVSRATRQLAARPPSGRSRSCAGTAAAPAGPKGIVLDRPRALW